MSVSIQADESEITILARVFEGNHGPMTDELARYILGLQLGEEDKARMHDLAVRNQDDALTPAEKKQLSTFARATSLLSLFKSRARLALKSRSDETPPPDVVR